MAVQLGQAAGPVYPGTGSVRTFFYEGGGDVQSTLPPLEVSVNLPACFQDLRMGAEAGRHLVQFLVGIQKRVKFAPAFGCFDVQAIWGLKRLHGLKAFR